MLEGNGLELDESLLTGEADSVDKEAGDEVLSGSFVVAGSGLVRATKVGARRPTPRRSPTRRSKFSLTRSELRDSILRFIRYVSLRVDPGRRSSCSSRSTTPTTATSARPSPAPSPGVITMVPEGLVLLTSVAMAVVGDPPRAEEGARPGDARRRGARPRRRRVRRQDRHAHRARHGRAPGGRPRRRTAGRRRAGRPRRQRARAQRDPGRDRRALPRRCRVDGRAHRAVLQRRASGRRPPSSGTARGCSGRRRCSCPRATRAREQADSLARDGARVLVAALSDRDPSAEGGAGELAPRRARRDQPDRCARTPPRPWRTSSTRTSP